jgi:hypothetical protein
MSKAGMKSGDRRKTEFFIKPFQYLTGFSNFFAKISSPPSKPHRYFPHCPQGNADREPGVCGGMAALVGEGAVPSLSE